MDSSVMPDSQVISRDVARGILQRSLNLPDLELLIPGECGRAPLATPVSAPCDAKGARPLHKLESLSVDSSFSPWLWEHLSRLGVKLTSVILGPAFSSMRLKIESSETLNHLLSMIRGPHLHYFKYSSVYGPSLNSSIQAAVFAYPRRSLSFKHISTKAGIRPESVQELEELELVGCSQSALSWIFQYAFAATA
jgi:hypothetical protein